MRMLILLSAIHVAIGSQPLSAQEDPPGKRVVQVSGKVQYVAGRILTYMIDLDVPVTTSQDGLIVAKYEPERGSMGVYTHSIHVALLQLNDSTTRVTMRAREYMDAGRTTFESPITERARGRAGKVWQAMVAIADSLSSR